VVLARSLYERADPGRGRLRTLVLSALRNFARDTHRREQTRGSGIVLHVSNLAHEETLLAAAGDESAGRSFDRRWALALFEEALRRAETHFLNTGRAGHWRLFDARVVHPALRCSEPEPLENAAAACGFRSAADGAAAVQTVKKRVWALLDEVIAETVEDPESCAEERALVLSLVR